MNSFEELRQRIAAPCWIEPGWRSIVVDAVERIEWLLAREQGAEIEWNEIKSWYATLAIRFEVRGMKDEVVRALIDDVAEAAKSRAARTCMECGEFGRLVENGERLEVLCRRHETTRAESGHGYDAEMVTAAIDTYIEKLELPWTIMSVVRGGRPREWLVSIRWTDEKRWIETWIENPVDGDEVERVIENGPVRLGEKRREPS